MTRAITGSNEGEQRLYELSQYRTDSFGLPADFVTDAGIEDGDDLAVWVVPNQMGTNLEFELAFGRNLGDRSNVVTPRQNSSTGQFVFTLKSTLLRVTPLREMLNWEADKKSQKVKLDESLRSTFVLESETGGDTDGQNGPGRVRARMTLATDDGMQVPRPFTTGTEAVDELDVETRTLSADGFTQGDVEGRRARLRFPLEYASYYGVESGDSVVCKAVVRDGKLGLAFETDPPAPPAGAVERAFHVAKTADDGTEYYGLYPPITIADAFRFLEVVDGEERGVDVELLPEPDHVIMLPA